MKFSIKKFSKLTTQRQKRKIYNWLNLILKNWDNVKARNTEIENLKVILPCLKKSQDKMLEEIFSRFSSKEVIQDRYFINNLLVFSEKFMDRNLKDQDFIILKKDKNSNKESLPIYVILNNLRSAFNIGSIFRTAECLNIAELIICGSSATPENNRLKSAMGTEQFVKWKHFKDLDSAVKYVKSKKCEIFALETTSNAVNYTDVNFPKPTALLLGNEALGLKKEDLRKVDKIIKLPVNGWKNSLNVGVTFAIAGYEIQRQWEIKND